MNLRIEGQRLRFRISKEELERLCSGGAVEQSTAFPNQCGLEINLVSESMDAKLMLVYVEGCMELRVQKQAAEMLLRSLPSREGIAMKQKVEAAEPLELILEVDIRTQK